MRMRDDHWTAVLRPSERRDQGYNNVRRTLRVSIAYNASGCVANVACSYYDQT